MFYDEVKKAPAKCDICEGGFGPADEKVVVEKKTMHKDCFKCAFCECELKPGKCASDAYFFHRYGPTFFCNSHSKLPPGQKEAQLVQRGVQPRQKGNKK